LGTRLLPAGLYGPGITPPWWDLQGGVPVNPGLNYIPPGWDLQGSLPVNPRLSYIPPGWDVLGGVPVNPAQSFIPPGMDVQGGVPVPPAPSIPLPGPDVLGGVPVAPAPSLPLPGPAHHHHPHPTHHQTPGLIRNLIKTHRHLRQHHPRHPAGGGGAVPTFTPTPAPTFDPLSGLGGFGGGGPAVSIGYDDSALASYTPTIDTTGFGFSGSGLDVSGGGPAVSVGYDDNA
jgi:hypothetical protein